MIDKYTAIILYVHVEDIECTKSKMRTVQFSSSLCTTIVTYTKEIKPPRIIYYIVRLLKKDKMKINIIFIIMLIQFFVNCLSVPVAKYMEGLGKFCGSKLAIELSILCKGKYNEARGNVNQRPKRGIVEECCLTSCTRKYIKDNYCGPESTEPNIQLK
ncbi:uncharacterized protein LOC113558272 [Rhopalosiphum maidis]|uniref:uncharacterized protein LOC113558272 n=1 Tax=Rhopalosiphum maidis TaxID=43146 RepID=UPI000EFDD79E|nr:uncharacterized protein LOC113558272 [Rhopalosiphum maidis]